MSWGGEFEGRIYVSWGVLGCMCIGSVSVYWMSWGGGGEGEGIIDEKHVLGGA